MLPIKKKHYPKVIRFFWNTAIKIRYGQQIIAVAAHKIIFTYSDYLHILHH